MNLSEAYKILDLQPGASEDELKKQFRKLAAKYHPDINKDPGSEETSKKISEAFNTIKNAPINVPNENHPGVRVRTWTTGGGPGVEFDMNEIFSSFINPFGGPFRRSENQATQPFKRQQAVETHLTLTFSEAVLGCKKQIVLEKFVKCAACYGKGFDISTDCSDCKGKGHSIKEEKIEGRDLKIKVNCTTCSGSGKAKINCKECDSGSKKAKTTLDIKLPGGIVTGTRLKLGGQGNYNRFSGADYYDDAHVSVTVTSEPGLSLSGMDVISNLDISLLDALRGSSQMVKTVKGAMSIQIPRLAKDKDRVYIAGAGVAGAGNHVIILNVKYPEDTNKLIDFLSEKE